jgi:lipooligosaccharide transport system permease protein
MSEALALPSSMRLAFLIAWRHFRIFKRDWFANISPTLIDPFLFVTVFGYWLGSQVSPYGSHSYLEFMAPGIAAMTALFTGFFEGSYAFYVRLEFEHVFKALLTTPVGPKEILFGELIWLGAKGAIMSLVVSLVLLVLGVAHGQYIYLIPIMGMMTAVTCGAIGLIAACYIRNISQFQTIYAWIISPMFFMSGMFVPQQAMPPFMQYACWISPFFHGVQLAQATLWAEGVGHAWMVHGTILMTFAAALIYWASRRILPRLEA